MPAVLVGTYVVKAELTGFRTATQASGDPRGQAGGAARLPDGGRGRAGDRRGHRQRADPADRDVDGRRGASRATTVQSLPLNGRNTGQLALLLPGTITYNPRGFTNIGSVNMNRPFVNGNREQTNNFIVDGFDVNETLDNRVAYQPSPDALAEISVETNNYSADTGNVGGAVVASVLKSGTNQIRGNVFEFYRNSDFDANTLGEQPLRRAEAGTAAGHLRRSRLAARSARQAVLLRRLPGLAAGRAGFRHGLGRARGLAPRRPVERRGRDSRSADRPAVPRQPDPGWRVSARWRGRCSTTRRTIRCPIARCPAASPATSSAKRCSRSVAIRATCASTGIRRRPIDKFFVRYSFATYEDARDVNPFPLVFSGPQRSAVLERRRQLEPHLRTDLDQRDCWSASATPG